MEVLDAEMMQQSENIVSENHSENTNGNVGSADEAIAKMKESADTLAAEVQALREMQNQATEEINMMESAQEIDARSVYVRNVDYGATAEELQKHFAQCGNINRITINCDAVGHSKGFAYIEFEEPSQIIEAIKLNKTIFRQRELKVAAKRTNLPGFSTQRGYRGGFRGRGIRGFRGRGRGRGRGSYNPY